MKKLSLVLYYLILNKLPHSTVPIIGLPCERLKEFLVKKIFKKYGTNVNVSKGARFGNGRYVEIGNNSSIGMNCKVPNNIIVSEDVMMGVGVTIFSANHRFDRIDIPMRKQGVTKAKAVCIENDVWI